MMLVFLSGAFFGLFISLVIDRATILREIDHPRVVYQLNNMQIAGTLLGAVLCGWGAL